MSADHTPPEKPSPDLASAEATPSEATPAGTSSGGAPPAAPAAASASGSGGGPPPNIISEQTFNARLKAHDFVQEHLKQIITISSAVIGLTVTFLKDIVGAKGDQLRFAWLLPVSWILLGLAVCFAAYAIAVHVNNLDWPNKKKPNASFAAGANNDSRILVLLTITLFWPGILSLGSFAAVNYDLLLKRGARDYKIVSAFQAVDEAKKHIDPSIQIVQLTKVELIKGVDESLAGSSVWNIQFEIKRPVQSQSAISSNVSPLIPTNTRCRRSCRYLCRCEQTRNESDTTQYNCLIDARSGGLLNIP